MTIDQIKQMDKDKLLSKENLIEVFKEESEIDRQYLLNALSDRAKELKCAKALNSLVKAFKDEIKSNSRPSTQMVNTCYFEPLNQELNCGNWIVDDSGIRVLTIFGEKTVCYHQIVPIENLFNIETKTEKITLAYKRHGGWKEITVDKGLIASSNKIVKLADYGISVTSETAKSLVQYLSDLENLNESIIPFKNSTSKF
jgi:hypothetical protein